MLPQDRAAALPRIEEARPQGAVDEEHDQRGGQHREGEHDEQARDEHVPGEDRQPEHRHARRAHREHRGEEVDRPQDPRGPGHHQPHDPEARPGARRVRGLGERRIAGPAERCRPRGGEESGVGHQRAGSEEPVGECVQPRKRDVRCADLQRDEVVAETDRHRGREEEDHPGAVHREELVVGRSIDDLEARRKQLGADEEREDPRQHEEADRGDDVEDPDDLVVGGGDDRHDPAARPASSRRHGTTRHGTTRHGTARPGTARCGAARSGASRRLALHLSGGHCAGSWFASQASNSWPETARIEKTIWSWSRPQNSAHWPV